MPSSPHVRIQKVPVPSRRGNAGANLRDEIERFKGERGADDVDDADREFWDQDFFKDDDGAQDDADGRYDDQGNWIPTGYEGQGYYDPAGNWVWVQEQQSQGWGQVSQGYADEQQGWGQDPQQQQGGGQWNQRY